MERQGGGFLEYFSINTIGFLGINVIPLRLGVFTTSSLSSKTRNFVDKIALFSFGKTSGYRNALFVVGCRFGCTITVLNFGTGH